MVEVVVTNDDGVHISQAFVSGAGHGDTGIVEDRHSGRIFEDQRAITPAILPGSRSERGNLNDPALLCNCIADRESCQNAEGNSLQPVLAFPFHVGSMSKDRPYGKKRRVDEGLYTPLKQ
jgi:hypothetical protein